MHCRLKGYGPPISVIRRKFRWEDLPLRTDNFLNRLRVEAFRTLLSSHTLIMGQPLFILDIFIIFNSYLLFSHLYHTAHSVKLYFEWLLNLYMMNISERNHLMTSFSLPSRIDVFTYILTTGWHFEAV